MSYPTRNSPATAAAPVSPTPRLRMTLLALALRLAASAPLGLAIASAAQAQTAQAQMQYEVPAGPLAEALNRFAQQAGVAIVMDAAQVQGLQSPGLRGRHGVDAGFALLLQGTGLAIFDRGNGGYSLQPAPEGAVVQLRAVKVSGSYQPLNAGVSGNQRVVTQDDLETLQANDLGDVFRRTPSVAVGGSLGIAEKIYVRGLEDALLNVSIDGATQAGVLFHHTGRLTVEPELLKRVEVHAGAGLATDGPGALGGAIRFISKDPDDLLRPGERLGVLFKGGYFDNNEGYKLSTNVFGRLSESWSAMATIAKADSDEITDGNGTKLAGTESEQTMGFAKVVGRIGEHQTLRLGYDRRKDDGIRPQRPQWVISSWNPGYPLKIERETTTVNHEWNPDTPWLQLETTLYFTQAELQQNVTNRWGLYYGGTESRGLNLRNTSQWGDHQLIYGVDYRDDRVNAGPGVNPKEQQEDADVLGFFVQDLYQVTDRLLATAGLRYDRYQLTDNTRQRFESDGFSPNVGLSYQVLPQLTLNAAYAEALRGRQTTETFLLDSRTNDPDLRAEEARNTELGFEFRKDAATLSGTKYWARIDHAINDQARVFHNIGDIRTDGYDLRISFDWSRMRAGVTYSNFKSELVNGGADLDLNAYDHGALGNTIGNTLSADLVYQLNAALEFGWNSRLVEGVRDVRTSAGLVDQPGYAVHDLYSRWQITRDFSVTVTALNLFNKHYLDHATNASYEHVPDYEGVVGLSEPGRDLRLTLAWRL